MNSQKSWCHPRFGSFNSNPKGPASFLHHLCIKTDMMGLQNELLKLCIAKSRSDLILASIKPWLKRIYIYTDFEESLLLFDPYCIDNRYYTLMKEINRLYIEKVDIDINGPTPLDPTSTGANGFLILKRSFYIYFHIYIFSKVPYI